MRLGGSRRYERSGAVRGPAAVVLDVPVCDVVRPRHRNAVPASSTGVLIVSADHVSADYVSADYVSADYVCAVAP